MVGVPEPDHVPAVASGIYQRNESWGYCLDTQDDVDYRVYDWMWDHAAEIGGEHRGWVITSSIEFPTREAAMAAYAKAQTEVQKKAEAKIEARNDKQL